MQVDVIIPQIIGTNEAIFMDIKCMNANVKLETYIVNDIYTIKIEIRTEDEELLFDFVGTDDIYALALPLIKRDLKALGDL